MINAKKANELSGNIIKDREYYIKDIEKYILKQIEINKTKKEINMMPCGDPLNTNLFKDSIKYVLNTDRYTKYEIINTLEIYGYKVSERTMQDFYTVLTISW